MSLQSLALSSGFVDELESCVGRADSAFMLAFIERMSDAALRLSGARSVFASTDGGRVHAYEMRGRGEGRFVLLHGMGATATSYVAVARQLLPFARSILLPELPGHGRSDKPARLDRHTLANGMMQALDQWITEPSVFLGTSLGGATALGVAIERPRMVKALVLASPAGAPLSDEELDALRHRFDLRTRQDARRFFEHLLHRPPAFFRLLEGGLQEQLGSETVQGFLHSISHEDFLKPEDLRAIACPIHVIWGRSDRILPRSSLEVLRATLPPSTVFEEPAEVGHSPHLEVPRAVAERMRSMAAA